MSATVAGRDKGTPLTGLNISDSTPFVDANGQPQVYLIGVVVTNSGVTLNGWYSTPNGWSQDASCQADASSVWGQAIAITSWQDGDNVAHFRAYGWNRNYGLVEFDSDGGWNSGTVITIEGVSMLTFGVVSSYTDSNGAVNIAIYGTDAYTGTNYRITWDPTNGWQQQQLQLQ